MDPSEEEKGTETERESEREREVIRHGSDGMVCSRAMSLIASELATKFLQFSHVILNRFLLVSGLSLSLSRFL